MAKFLWVCLFNIPACLVPMQALRKIFHASHYMKSLHEAVRHIIGAQRGMAYERSGQNIIELYD
jgi:hypothetical protein